MLSLPETLDERMKSKPERMTEEEFVKELTMWQFFYSDEEKLTLEEYCDRLRDALSFEKKDIAGLLASEGFTWFDDGDSFCWSCDDQNTLVEKIYSFHDKLPE